MPRLAAGECHIWTANLQMELDHSVLSPDEVERGQRLLAPAAQRRFATSRSVLRRLCAAYTGRAPEAIRFCYGEHGKPALESSRNGLHFNVSHTGDLAVLAFTTDGAVGVDVEEIRQMDAFDCMLQEFCSAADQQWVREGGEAQQLHRFLRCWTRLEARAKATGNGLQRTWEQMDSDRAQHLAIVHFEFATTPTTVACVAFQGFDPALSFHKLEGHQGDLSS